MQYHLIWVASQNGPNQKRPKYKTAQVQNGPTFGQNGHKR